jgi:hypothetical protein
VRASDTAPCSTPSHTGDVRASLLDFAGRYLQVEVTLRSDDPDVTPSIREIVVATPPPPAVAVDEPVDGGSIPSGTSLILTGQAVAAQPLLIGPNRVANAIAFVTVNGVPVDALDATGNFFSPTSILPGRNEFTIRATDAFGQTTTTTVTVQGTQQPVADVNFGDVGHHRQFPAEYARPRSTKTPTCSRRRRDRQCRPVRRRRALFIGITNISDPTVRPAPTA